MLGRFVFILVCFTSSFLSFSQDMDSLIRIWENKSNIAPKRLDAIQKAIDKSYVRTNPDSAYLYAVQQERLAKRIDNKRHIAQALYTQGQALRLQGKPKDALEKILRSQLCYESMKDSVGIGKTFQSLGQIHFTQKNYEKSFYYIEKSLEIREKLSNELDIASSLNSLAFMHDDVGNYDLALKIHLRCLDIRKRINDQQGISWSYNNIARVYFHQKRYNAAEEFYKKSIELKTAINDYTLGETKGNLGLMYLELGRFEDAIFHCEEGYKAAKEVNFSVAHQLNCDCLYKAYKEAGNSDEALLYYEELSELKDSLFSLENTRGFVMNEVQYEFKLKNAMDRAETKKKVALMREESRRHRAITNFLIVGFVFLILASVYIFRSLRKSKRQQKLIQNQVAILNQKNLEITDSIQYAKRIQNAILPPKKLVKQLLPDSFIFYQPKDVVSGDFYWMDRHQRNILFCAADCTGHGVPGAMVSVVCHNALNRSIQELNLTSPGEILNKTREIVIEQFEKSEDHINDGMDISLCSLDPNSLELRWAGANNPLWILRNNELIETKPNKQPIGKYFTKDDFTTHTFQLEKGDMIYLFSDGYADQFGGEKNKKFKRSAFRKLLLKVKDLSLDNQKQVIKNAFEEWKGDQEQVDDICIIGVRI